MREPALRRLDFVVALALAALGLVLRLVDLRLMELKADEAETLRLASLIVGNHDFPTAGLNTSLGGHIGPLLHELTALAMFFSRDPVVITALVVAVPSAIAVGLSYLVLRVRLGAFVALATAILFACAPWAVLYGRKLWPQCWFPLPAVALLHAILVLRERPTSRIVAAVPVLLSVMLQLQLSALAIVVVVIVCLARQARALDRRALAIGVALGLLIAAPYLVHFVQGRMDELRMISSSGLDRGRPRSLADPVVQTFAISGDTRLEYALGGLGGEPPRALTWASGAFAVLAASGLLLGLLALVRARPGVALRTCVTWILTYWATCALAGAFGLRLWPHYFIILYPLPFLLPALALDFLRERWPGRRLGALVAAGLLGWIVLADLGALARIRTLLRSHGAGFGDYAVVYDHKARLSAWVVANNLVLAEGAPDEFRTLVGLARRLGAPLAPGQSLPTQGLPPGGVVDVHCCGPDPVAEEGCVATRSFGPLVACVRR